MHPCVRPAIALWLLVSIVLAPSVGASGGDPFQELSLIRPSRLMPAGDFTVAGLESERLRLSDFKGNVVLLNFWATWCPPCKEEMPSMERLYRRFKARGLTVLAISIDAADGDRVAEFARDFGLTFPIGLDPQLDVANLYAVRGLPASVLIDRSGRIVAMALGPRDWDSRAAHAVIEALLK
jgi:peroxiredoxin